MELKKSEKADLENKKNVFLLIGLVAALGITLLAFEWTTKPAELASLGTLDASAVEEEVIPITRQEEMKTPPPPPPQTVVEVLNIVDNNAQVNDDLSIFDSEADNETFVDVAPIVQAKEEKEEAEEAQVFFIVEEMPEFPGGEAALRAFIAKSINYPVIAQENGIQGKVYVTFVVDKDGGISEAKIARGVDPSLDKEALRVVNSLPKWKPGKQRGKPVRVSYTVPISFVLQ
ncbi:MAG: energy transducer TonB [Prolixibacteraceae bacterium]|jgi:protein TonB|nr:energy transducer TonB [Prolixibacteraceae bacterium]NLX29339.1 energy transducer TonB [Bacteroidales bacterium]HNQ38681.1 energy transducer TonB [Prolixibacteraceae bacterium]HPJ77917.1 energy transducer TonB [Prolixibacteraceae bacterium]HRV88628.1 energy transducer TonB [Prolixibacteraceae bacterium]